jgi:hypothetical protein
MDQQASVPNARTSLFKRVSKGITGNLRRFNQGIASFLHISTTKVLQAEIAIWALSMMQIGEHFLAICLWLVFCSIWLRKAYAWAGISNRAGLTWLLKTAHIIVALVCSCLIVVITVERRGNDPWSNVQKLWQPKSVLVMKSWMIGSYGPTATSTQIVLEIKNPPEDAIQNLDLTLSRASTLPIKPVAEDPFKTNDCKPEPVNLLPDQRLLIKGADGRSGMTLDMEEMFNEYIKHNGSPKWRLKCQRLSGYEFVRFEIVATGDAEKDSLQISGTYERIPSKGSTVVRVNSKIPITK